VDLISLSPRGREGDAVEKEVFTFGRGKALGRQREREEEIKFLRGSRGVKRKM